MELGRNPDSSSNIPDDSSSIYLPSFEVATIEPVLRDASHPSNSREWANHDRFDIEARFPEGADKKDDRLMLQTLLKERFQLAFHIEKREMEGYALVVGKHGDKLKPSLPDPVTPEADALAKRADRTIGEGSAKAKVIKKSNGSGTDSMGKKGNPDGQNRS